MKVADRRCGSMPRCWWGSPPKGPKGEEGGKAHLDEKKRRIFRRLIDDRVRDPRTHARLTWWRFNRIYLSGGRAYAHTCADRVSVYW